MQLEDVQMNMNVNGGNNNAAQDPFGEHRWTGKYINPFKPKVIGHFKVFCLVALRAMDEEKDRMGSRALSNKIGGTSESAVNKNLRFVSALIKKNVRFADIPDLNQSLDEHSMVVLGYSNYASVSKDTKTGISGMTREQIRKLLS